MGVVAPNTDADLLAFEGNDGLLDREVHREPAVHTWRVLGRICAIENVLVELRCEVSSEAMDLTLLLLDCEVNSIILAHAGAFSLPISLDLL